MPASDAGAYDFARAFPVGESLVVPTRGGAAVLTPAGRPEDPERFLRRYGNATGASGDGTVEVAAIRIHDGDNPPPTEIRTDGVGLLAWVPWDDGLDAPGGTGVARHVGGAWSMLPAGDGWAERPVHLMPLADGSVLQIAVDDAGDAEMRTLPLNKFEVDRASVEQLVANLTAYDRPTRDAAFAQLSQAGAAVWPVLEELKESARPRARAEIEQLLATRDSPTLGGLIPEPGPVRVRSRLGDGGAVLAYADGVAIPDVAGVSVLRRPAYLIVRPGKRVGPLSDLLVSELEADPAANLFAYGDELIVGGDGEGPRRFGLNHFAPVLGEADGHFDVPLGIDRLGRWLFRQSGGDAGRTLVLDVRLADPAPSLPTWVIETGELGEAGWDPADWPTMKLGGAWRLMEAGWEVLPPETEVGTRETKSAGGWELAVGPDGRRYFGGIDSLRVVTPGGEDVSWPLPAEAVGTGRAAQVKLAVDDEGRLFLFNRPGRVVRIEPTEGDADQPYEVIGVFTEQIPGAVPRRVWIDPAGRVCAAYFGDTVVVMWPDGQVPAPIRQMMPAERREEPRGMGGV